MKALINLFLAGFLTAFICSCQSSKLADNALDSEMYDISVKDAVKSFSHTPTGVVYVEGIKIDFSCDEHLLFQTSDKDYILLRFGDKPVINTMENSYDDFREQVKGLSDSQLKELNLDTVRTVVQLAALYNGFVRNKPNFEYDYSNSYYPFIDAAHIYTTVEYLLAQACFQDDCSTQTRKAVLKMAVEKQTYKFEEYKIGRSCPAIKTGIFLMTTILAKEKDPAFLDAARKNSVLQDAMRMNIDDFRISDAEYMEYNNFVSQFAINYLLNE